jgi:hypothetical protein
LIQRRRESRSTTPKKKNSSFLGGSSPVAATSEPLLYAEHSTERKGSYNVKKTQVELFYFLTPFSNGFLEQDLWTESLKRTLDTGELGEKNAGFSSPVKVEENQPKMMTKEAELRRLQSSSQTSSPLFGSTKRAFFESRIIRTQEMGNNLISGDLLRLTSSRQLTHCTIASHSQPDQAQGCCMPPGSMEAPSGQQKNPSSMIILFN